MRCEVDLADSRAHLGLRSILSPPWKLILRPGRRYKVIAILDQRLMP